MFLFLRKGSAVSNVLVRQVIGLLSYSVLIRLMSIITSIYLASYVGLEVYGQLVLVLAAWGWLSAVHHGGYYKVILVEKGYKLSQIISLRIISIVVSLLFLCSSIIFFKQTIRTEYVLIIVLSLVANLMTLPWQIHFEKLGKFNEISKIRLVSQSILSLSMVVASFTQYLVLGGLIGVLLSQLVMLFHFVFVYSKEMQEYKASVDRNIVKTDVIQDFKEAVTNLSANLLSASVLHGDKYFIAALYDARFVGLYNLLFLIFSQPANLLGQSLYKPLLLAVRSEGRKKFSRHITDGRVFIFLILVFIMSLLSYPAALMYIQIFNADDVLSLLIPMFIGLFVFKLCEWIFVAFFDSERQYSIRVFSSASQLVLMLFLYWMFIDQEGYGGVVGMLLIHYLPLIVFYFKFRFYDGAH